MIASLVFSSTVSCGEIYSIANDAVTELEHANVEIRDLRAELDASIRIRSLDPDPEVPYWIPWAIAGAAIAGAILGASIAGVTH